MPGSSKHNLFLSIYLCFNAEPQDYLMCSEVELSILMFQKSTLFILVKGNSEFAPQHLERDEA